MHKLKIISVAGLSVLFLIFLIGIPTELFGRFPFLDIPMHFGGGFFAALFGVAFLERGFIKTLPGAYAVLLIVGATMMIGVGWEWFEWLVDEFLIPNFMGGRNDTLLDLFMDETGGFLAAMMFLRKKERY